MSLSLYMDHNVHAGITRGLRRRAVDCITAEEDGMDRAPDPELLSRATELGRVVFTQDTDVVELATNWISQGEPFTGVIYARQMGITIGQAVQDRNRWPRCSIRRKWQIRWSGFRFDNVSTADISRISPAERIS